MARKTAEKVFNLAAFLRGVGPGTTFSEYGKGRVVFAQGEPADAVFYLQKGNITIKVSSRQGKEAVIGVLGTGSFFGEGCLTSPVRMSTAVAMDRCRILRVKKTRMVQVLQEEKSFTELFLAHLLSRNTRIEEDLVDQLFNSSEKRLARVLLLLANFGKDGQPDHVIPRMSQETLASIVGTTRSRVSFFMNRFRQLGFIEYNGGLHIRSSLLNIVLQE
jgi:CRP/FNR family transcriptional regulator, cyclic AMP receptor protein